MRSAINGALYGATQCEPFTAETTLVVIDCADCGITFAIPQRLDSSAREHNRAINPRNYWRFCCPMGHELSYPGKNEEQELRDRLQRERDHSARLAAERDQLGASAQAYRGAATRARNERDKAKQRHAAGVCPCCHRSFKQLRRHMSAKHPDYEAAPDREEK